MQKHPSQQNISLETKNRFAPPQNTQDEMLDKEAKNYKEKQILQYNTLIIYMLKQVKL